MRSYKTTGIILRRTNYAEADRIITFITPEHGKVEAIARGVRKQGAKLASHLELFSESELMLVVGKNLDVLTSARALHSYDQLATSYEALRRAFLLCEMLSKLTDKHTSPEMYQLLKECLKALNEGIVPELVELYFKLRLLDMLGYRPNLEQCMQSKQEIDERKKYRFSSEAGGLVEQDLGNPSQPKITQDHIKLWRLTLQHPLSKLAKIGGTAQAAEQSLPIANDFYDYLFGKRFKSAEI